jgi:hypothetical protein
VVQEDVLNVLCLFAHVLGLLLGGRLPRRSPVGKARVFLPATELERI